LLVAKGSYRSKYIAKTGDTGTQSQGAKRYSNITPELKAEYEEGKLILIDKPIHWTSFDVVKCIRTHLRIKKVGHAGTLDPLATGLLIICTGKYTKKINEYMAQVKEYTGTITLGSVTPTYDLESLPEQHKDYSSITLEKIKETIPSFLGHQKQMPPIYSAIKVAGKPLYELARRGKGLELEPRDIIIDAFEITSFEPPLIGFRLVCSTGTYVRSVAHDIGVALGCGAHLSLLRRTAIGEFNVDDAQTMDVWLDEIKMKSEIKDEEQFNQNA